MSFTLTTHNIGEDAIVYNFVFKNQHELTTTFCRLQEFYESPKETINGKYFTLDEFIDAYASCGELTYFGDWIGFNVPGNIVNNFYRLFKHDLRDKEKQLFEQITELSQETNKNFYIIGSFAANSALDHEFAHALYYLKPDYKQVMLEQIQNLGEEAIIDLKKRIINRGYCENVLDDEIQAYLSTSDSKYMKKLLALDKVKFNKMAKPFKKEFKKHYKELNIQNDQKS